MTLPDPPEVLGELCTWLIGVLAAVVVYQQGIIRKQNDWLRRQLEKRIGRDGESP